MIALSALAFLRNPEQLAELRGSTDPKLFVNTVEEMLRYLTIVQNGLRRVAVEDIRIGDKEIKAGDGVVFAINAANRDEGAFPDSPDEVDIHRLARHHVAFG